jgi:hypothetical protein
MPRVYTYSLRILSNNQGRGAVKLGLSRRARLGSEGGQEWRTMCLYVSGHHRSLNIYSALLTPEIRRTGGELGINAEILRLETIYEYHQLQSPRIRGWRSRALGWKIGIQTSSRLVESRHFTAPTIGTEETCVVVPLAESQSAGTSPPYVCTVRYSTWLDFSNRELLQPTLLAGMMSTLTADWDPLSLKNGLPQLDIVKRHDVQNCFH